MYGQQIQTRKLKQSDLFVKKDETMILFTLIETVIMHRKYTWK